MGWSSKALLQDMYMYTVSTMLPEALYPRNINKSIPIVYAFTNTTMLS